MTPGFTTAGAEGDVAVLLIGMRINHFWAVHHKAWQLANRKIREGRTRGHVGLWHGTYIALKGSYESIYFDMPPTGLAAAHGTLPLERRGRRAAERFAHRSA